MKLAKIVLILALASIPGSYARAEMAPEAYARMQAAATEDLNIEVKDVQTQSRKCGDNTCVNVTATAIVTKVLRTGSQVKAEQRIKISYERTERKVALIGPAEIPLLKTGQKCDAFLNWNAEQKTYVPAARGRSFKRIVTAQKTPKQS